MGKRDRHLVTDVSVRTPIEQTKGLYFITFTCCHWLPLFEIVEGYDTAYK
jgi:hypothetical protein